MSATLVGVVQVLALLLLIAAFTYGFVVRVSWRSVIAAALASGLYLASFGPTVLARYRFEQWGVLLLLAAVGALVFAALAWLFVRWPAVVAPTLAVLAAVRLPIPVHRGVDLGAAPEYLFLLVPLYVATVAALVAEAVRPDSDPQALFRRDPLRLSLAALIAWAALSTLWSGGEVQAAIRLYSFWLLLPAAYHAMWRAMQDGESRGLSRMRLALGEEQRCRWLPTVQTLVGLAGILAIVGIDQHFRHWLWFKNTNLEATEWQQVIFRVNAIFWDPNMFARFLLLAGLLAGALWLGCRSRGRWLGLAAIPMLFAFYFTYSRACWLVAVVIAAFVAWLALGWKRGVAVLVALTLLVGVMFVVIRAPTFRRTTVQILEASLGVVKDGKLQLAAPVNQLTGGRYGLMAGGVRMAAARPVTGWGLGSFPSVYPEYMPAGAPERLRESHNSVITIGAELGLVGLGLLAWVLVTVVMAMRAAFKGRGGIDSCRVHPFAVAVIAGLVAIFLHSMLYAALIEDPFTWVFLALLGGIMCVTSRVGAATGEAT